MKQESDKSERDKYIVPDVLRPGLITVFCGRAPSPESARRRAYYAHRSNKFWEILAKTGLTDRQLKPEEFGELPAYGIGLTDINKVESGSDHELTGSGDDPSSVYLKIERYQPQVLAFTGKNNCQMYLNWALGVSKSKRLNYGWQESIFIGETRLFVLPSTSARARGYWDEQPWFMLAEWHINRLSKILNY